MKTITRYILMVMVAISVSWGMAPNEVRAIATPCEQLASLDNEKERLEERLAEAEAKVEELEPLREAAWDAYEDKCIELWGFCCLDPIYLLYEIVRLRAEGNEEGAEHLESLYNEILPFWTEWMARDYELWEWKDKVEKLEASLENLPDRRFALMVDCGLVQEMSDPLEISERRVPRSLQSDAQMQNPMDSDANQARNETHDHIPFGVAERVQTTQTATGQVAMPETQTDTVAPSRARLFNDPLQGSTPGVAQTESTPAATGQTMQVQQQENTDGQTNAVGFTHMPLTHNVAQSGQAAASHKTLRGIVRVRQMRLHVGPSVKR